MVQNKLIERNQSINQSRNNTRKSLSPCFFPPQFQNKQNKTNKQAKT